MSEPDVFPVESLRLAEIMRGPLTLARTHSLATMIARSAGDPDKVRWHPEQSLAYSSEVCDPSARVAALTNLSLASGRAGKTEKTISTLGEAPTFREKLGEHHREAALRNNLADLLHRAGREEEAIEALKTAVGVFAEIGGEGNWQPEIRKLAEW